MNRKHIAFCVEPAYGHILPTLGITLELLKRGHLVSYAVTDSFVPIIHRLNAVAKVIHPIENRSTMISALVKDNDCFNWKVRTQDLDHTHRQMMRERTADLLIQLMRLYEEDRPDVIIHNSAQDSAGIELSASWAIPRIRHETQFIDVNASLNLDRYENEKLIIVTVPKVFQRDFAHLDQRFRFVGFIPEGRLNVFDQATYSMASPSPILVSATTGLMPQVQFCETIIDAFGGRPINVILSISGSHDVLSKIKSEQLPKLPRNISLNTAFGNFDLLRNCRLYIGQGGQGSTLEAIFQNVRQIVIPPTPYHYSVARRIDELGLGASLPANNFSPQRLLDTVESVLEDQAMLSRVDEMSNLMRIDRGASVAADLIEGTL